MRKWKIVVPLIGIGLTFVWWHGLSNAAPFPLGARPVVAYQLGSVIFQKGDVPSVEANFHDYRIETTRTDVPDDVLRELVQSLESRSTYTDNAYKCFDPGMGFTFGNGPERVEVLICLACRRADFCRGNKWVNTCLSGKGIARLDAVYRRLFTPTTQPTSRDAVRTGI